MKERKVVFLSLALAVVTLALFWPSTHYDFVNYDDEQYVYENPWVAPGLSLAGLKWAFTGVYAANWHPVTWVSHMLDCSVFGLFAGGHHLTNVLLHTLNTVLLFLLLNALTGAVWPAAMAAALFGWHPLHVESVAWIAERKDLLSTLFLLLSLWAYARYARTLKARPYGMALLFFALGLMSKPMVVTLPFLLLLLDYWPLRRMGGADEPAPRTVARLFLEKIPFFALAIAASVVTVAAQHSGGALKTLGEVSFGFRALNGAAAYGWYLCKTIFPDDLCVFCLVSRICGLIH